MKDFRYEPISFLFKRYHLSVLLIPLIRDFLTGLKNNPILPPRIADFISQMIQAILLYYKDPDLSSVTPLENALTRTGKTGSRTRALDAGDQTIAHHSTKNA